MEYFGLKLGQDLRNRVAHPYQELRGQETQKLFFETSQEIATETLPNIKFLYKNCAKPRTFAISVLILTVCLSGNLQIVAGREQKDLRALYNSRLRGAFVTWQEAAVVLARQITVATRPLCSPLCTRQQRCAVQDTCVANTGGTRSLGIHLVNCALLSNIASAFVFLDKQAFIFKQTAFS